MATSTPPTAEMLRAALRGVADPASGQDIVAAGLVEGVEIRGGLVQVSLLTTRERAAAMEPVRAAAERTLAGVAGVQNATVVLTAQRAPSSTPAARAGHGQPGHQHGHGPGAGGAGPKQPLLLPDVGAIIAVASGKGGVGKSTVAVNLAVALAKQGLKVGLLDADIYGPSLPRMLGLARKPEVKGDRIQPLNAWGVKAMSIGFLVEEETPMMLRGPMVMGALEQMLGNVDWGALDVLVVDMPPGTGDAQLTMSQRVALTGAVIVSTPQDIALIDARRGVRAFERVKVPVLGIVENMSFYCCPNCNHRVELFGHGGAKAEAHRLGAPFLGEVPLQLAIRETGDSGTPITAAQPDSEPAKAFAEIAAKLWQQVKAKKPATGPRIVVS